MRFKTRILSGLTTVIAVAGLTMATTASASAAPMAAASDTIMSSCFDQIVNGEVIERGCTYYNFSSHLFTVCDTFADQTARYTRGKMSVNGVLKQDLAVYRGCLDSVPVAVRVGDLVCIHTGIEGIGWIPSYCLRA